VSSPGSGGAAGKRRMAKTVSIKTLGCKLNQYESALIADKFIRRGWEIRPFGETVDLVIVNTCTVTDRSDRKCRNYIRQGARFSRLGRTVVTGCLAERAGTDLNSMPEVAAVFRNAEKADLCRRLEGLMGASPEGAGRAAAAGDEWGAENPLPFGHTRGYLKIQDGCDGHCAFCVVPSVRGAPRSRGLEAVIDHARRLIGSGCPELILTGVTIGRYESGNGDLAAAVEALAALPGDFRLRITSIEPHHLGERLIGLLGSGKVCPHIHLPLQSGSDRVLRSMNRPYTAGEYLALVEKIRKKDDRIALGTDIIIGFPGEDEADFQRSLDAVRQAGFSYVHQFGFSPRSGTPASRMNGRCAGQVMAERSARIREHAREEGLRYRRRFVGSLLPSVVEKNARDAGFTAVSDNYIKIRLEENPCNGKMAGTIRPVRLLGVGSDGARGVVVP
jgi:threonylcarbamoyladenosine tRNA methylthiotransferase MtaB